MAFRNIPPNGFPAIPDIEDLEAVVKDVSTLKTTTAGLAEDVGDLEDQKANQITIALPFNPETEYEVGDLVYYNGLSYRCTNAHTGEWDADDFASTTIANELSTLKSGLTEVNNIIIDRKNVVSGDKIPWVNFASGLIIWSAAGMASGSGILFVGADNTAITYTSLSHGGNIDISASDFDFANGELEFKHGFIQVVIVKLTNA